MCHLKKTPFSYWTWISLSKKKHCWDLNTYHYIDWEKRPCFFVLVRSGIRQSHEIFNSVILHQVTMVPDGMYLMQSSGCATVLIHWQQYDGLTSNDHRNMISAYYEALRQVHYVLSCISSLQSGYVYALYPYSSFVILNICVSNQLWQVNEKLYLVRTQESQALSY